MSSRKPSSLTVCIYVCICVCIYSIEREREGGEREVRIAEACVWVSFVSRLALSHKAAFVSFGHAICGA